MDPINGGSLWGGGSPDAPLGSSSPFDLLEPPLASGFLKLSRPCCYVFPSGRGDSALFAVGGFNLLVDGGSEARSCFWKLVRHLDRVDATILTHTGTDNLPGFASFLRRKISEAVAEEGGVGSDGETGPRSPPPPSSSPAWSLRKSPNLLISPELGVVFYNVPEKSNNNSNNAELAAAAAVAAARDKGSLEVSTVILESLEKLRVAPQPLFRLPAPAIEPVILFHKLGVGHLDMYVLSPVREGREGNPLGQKLPLNRAKGGNGVMGHKESGAAAPAAAPCATGTDSVAVLVVWHPADPTERIVRVLFPGNAPQAKVLEGLEKLKHLEFLKIPLATQRDVTSGTTAAKNASPGQKAASKENMKSSSSRSSSSRRNLNKEAVEKSDANNRQSKGGEKMDKRDPLAKNKLDLSFEAVKNRGSVKKDGKKPEVKRDAQKVSKNDTKPAGKKDDERRSPKPAAKAAGPSSEGRKGSAKAKSPKKEAADIKKPLAGVHPKLREKLKGRVDASAGPKTSPTSSPEDLMKEFDEVKQDNLQAMMAVHKALVSESPSDIFVSEEQYVEKIIPSPVHEDYSKTPDSTDVAESMLSPDEGITTTDVEADLDSSPQEDQALNSDRQKNERCAPDKNQRNASGAEERTEAGGEKRSADGDGAVTSGMQQESNEFLDKAETEAVEKHAPKAITSDAETRQGRTFDAANTNPETISVHGAAAAPLHPHADTGPKGSASDAAAMEPTPKLHGGASAMEKDVANVTSSQTSETSDFPPKTSSSPSRESLALPSLEKGPPSDGVHNVKDGAVTEGGTLRAPTSILHRTKTPSCERSVLFDLTPLEIKLTPDESPADKGPQGLDKSGEGDALADTDSPTRSPPSSAGHTPYNLSPVDEPSFLFEEAAAAREQEEEDAGLEEPTLRSVEESPGSCSVNQTDDHESARTIGLGATETIMNEIKDIANKEVIHLADTKTFSCVPFPDDEKKETARHLANEVLLSLGMPGNASEGPPKAAREEHDLQHQSYNRAAGTSELTAKDKLKTSAVDLPSPKSTTPTEDSFLQAGVTVSTTSIATSSFLNEPNTRTMDDVSPSLPVDVGSPQSTEVDESLSTSVENPSVGRGEASRPMSASPDQIVSPGRADEVSGTMASDQMMQKQHGPLASSAAFQLDKCDNSSSSSSSPARVGGHHTAQDKNQSATQAAQPIDIPLCKEDRQKCLEASASTGGGDPSVMTSGQLQQGMCEAAAALTTPGQLFPSSARLDDPTTAASSWATRPQSNVDIETPSTSVNNSVVSSSDSEGPPELGHGWAAAAIEESPLACGPAAAAGAASAVGPAAREQTRITEATPAPISSPTSPPEGDPCPARSAARKLDPTPPPPDPAVRMVDPELANYGPAMEKMRGGAATKRDPQSVKTQKQPRVKTPSPGANAKSLGKATTPPGRPGVAKKSPGDVKTTTGVKKKGGGGSAGGTAPPTVYVDLAYIPAHGAQGQVDAEFFRRVRATHYVLSGNDAGGAAGGASRAPGRATLDALLAGRAEWGVDHTVTLIPTYDTAAVRGWYQETHERQRELGIMVLASSSTVVMQSESFPACKIEF
ncbi:uncharacterized protein LOC116954930 [Petromyzon marinus]|uniref:Microtubule-associated protein 1A-like n=1 Tax=Petromyzon marinus TaxID=7757 RepID=A0AAJ7XFT1_PETMA|nr:microtubule-associated protein 1A-like [Petromyzon marinus]